MGCGAWPKAVAMSTQTWHPKSKVSEMEVPLRRRPGGCCLGEVGVGVCVILREIEDLVFQGGSARCCGGKAQQSGGA